MSWAVQDQVTWSQQGYPGRLWLNKLELDQKNSVDQNGNVHSFLKDAYVFYGGKQRTLLFLVNIGVNYNIAVDLLQGNVHHCLENQRCSWSCTHVANSVV